MTEPEKSEYQPTPAEAAILPAIRERMRASEARPGIKFGAGRDGKTTLDVAHPDVGIGTLLLMNSIGTADLSFLDGFLAQLTNSASKGAVPDLDATNFALSVVKGVEPRDQIEAMLAAQMAAVHSASMTFARRLAQAGNVVQQEAAERIFTKMARTFAAQVAALKDYRSKGEQKVTVQHVHVSEGGQAVIGNVNAASRGSAQRKPEGQSHAISDARSAAVLCEVEAERATVPSAGRPRSESVPDARRQGGRAAGKSERAEARPLRRGVAHSHARDSGASESRAQGVGEIG